MADWSVLYIKTQDAVEDAHGYLRRRTSFTTSAPELERLQALEGKIQSSASGLYIFYGDVGNQHDDFQRYFADLDQSHSQILDLHESDPVEKVESAIENIKRYVVVMAGPHGPGKGDPTGGGSGWPR
jgi:hypothetical protein